MTNAASSQSPAITRRPWYRLHFSTWLVVAIGVILGVLLILPGEEGLYPDDGSMHQARAVIHGWPWPYLWRTPLRFWSFLPVAETPPSIAWNVFDGAKRLNLFFLLADICACASIVAIAAAVIEWRRRRARRFQFTLRSLFLFVTVTSFVLAWWGFERAADQALREHLAAYWGTARPDLMVPRLPFWVRIAIGDAKLLPLGISKPSVTDYEWTRAQHQHIQYFIQRYPRLLVRLEKPSNDDLERFFELNSLHGLIASELPQPFFVKLNRLENLEFLLVEHLNDDSLIRLGRVASLRKADFRNSAEISDAAWDQFASTSHLESLALHRMHLNDSSLSSIAKMQRLRFLRIYRSPITDEGLASLAANHRIEELGLPETLITDAGLAYLKSMSTVRWLDLYNTAVTKGAVNSLRAVNPDLEITYIAEAPELADLKTKIDDVKAGKTTYFAIAGWKIQDRHLSELGGVTGIESLALNAHHLTDATLAHVELLERLKELDISSSLITGRGLRHLLKLPKLRTLTLDDRQIDDEAINALKQLPALKELWVKCDVGDADLKRLEARMNAAFANDPTFKRHFDRQSDSHSPWD